MWKGARGGAAVDTYQALLQSSQPAAQWGLGAVGSVWSHTVAVSGSLS